MRCIKNGYFYFILKCIDSRAEPYEINLKTWVTSYYNLLYRFIKIYY